MTAHERLESLTFWSFVHFAIRRVSSEQPLVDLDAMRLVLMLHRVTSMVVYDLESSVHRPRGWSWPGFRLLFILWVGGPMEAKRAAELSGMSRAAVSALVNTLERDGLVNREHSTQDRRAVVLSLTGRGSDAIVEAFTAHNEREQLWASSLTSGERKTLFRLLRKMSDQPSRGDVRRRA